MVFADLIVHPVQLLSERRSPLLWTQSEVCEMSKFNSKHDQASGGCRRCAALRALAGCQLSVKHAVSLVFVLLNTVHADGCNDLSQQDPGHSIDESTHASRHIHKQRH
jgi:hypothetical protein